MPQIVDGPTRLDADRDHALAALFFLILQPANAAQFRKHFFRGFLADMAGVENHKIRARRLAQRRIAQRRQRIRHARGVVDVHLAAPGFDM